MMNLGSTYDKVTIEEKEDHACISFQNAKWVMILLTILIALILLFYLKQSMENPSPVLIFMAILVISSFLYLKRWMQSKRKALIYKDKIVDERGQCYEKQSISGIDIETKRIGGKHPCTEARIFVRHEGEQSDLLFIDNLDPADLEIMKRCFEKWGYSYDLVSNP